MVRHKLRHGITCSHWLSVSTSCSILLPLLFLAAIPKVQGQSPGLIDMEVLEESAPGIFVGWAKPLDNYQYAFQDQTDLFQISPGGEVTTKIRIDRDKLKDPVIRLFVIGTPTNPQDKQVVFNVDITVLDLNDNGPTFNLDGQTETISFQEDARESQVKHIAIATDPDQGENGNVTKYQIVSGNEDGMFQLDLTSLPYILYIAKRKGSKGFDREAVDHYQLNISARDNGVPPRYGFLLVDITIVDVNDNPPSFDMSEYRTQVNESTPVGTSVFRLEATDDDIGLNGEVVYHLEDATNQFSVDENTGVIRTLKSPLSCSRRCERSTTKCNPNSCFIKVKASDKGLNALSGRAYLYIEILDENDHDPVITFSAHGSQVSTVLVDENVSIQSVVVEIDVTDEDSGNNGKTNVSIVRGNEQGYFFHFYLSIPSVTLNELRVVKKLDRESIKRFNLTFKAVDNGNPRRSSTATLIILVNDANDHYPEFEKIEYRVSLSELTKVHSLVASLKATDKDEGRNSELTYEIFSGNELGWFAIDPVTGLVTTVKKLDYEQTSRVRLNISAHDGGPEPRYNYTLLVVDIVDENDLAPNFTESVYRREVKEDTPVGTVLLTVTAMDRDRGVNGSVQYSVHPDTQVKYPGYFSVNRNDGRVELLKSLDRETLSEYRVKIVASDRGVLPLSSTATVELVVTDDNDNSPVFSPEVNYVNIFDTDPKGVQVIRVTATDKDVGGFGKVYYSLKNLFNDFGINRETGVISTKKQLPIGDYRVTVTAVDGGGRTSENEATVNVIVTSITSSAPVFSQKSYTFEITEDDSSSSKPAQLDRRVGQVKATSPTSSSLLYAITGGDTEGVFRIDSSTGEIFTRLDVDREMKEEYSLTVIAYAGERISSLKVTILVKDVNDNDPRFVTETTEALVLENWPVGHNVFMARALDSDAGINADVSYSLSGPSVQDANGVFTINASTGVISVAKSLRLLPQDHVTLVVTATDAGTPQKSKTMEVKVKVVDENDHTPLFPKDKYELFISEDQPVNERIILFEAYDGDTGPNGDLTYSITRGNEERRFDIFPDGSLYLAHRLDREKKDMYLLTVMVEDSGEKSRSSSVNVSIYIQDVNDNEPHFEQSQNDFDVSENAGGRTYVGSVKAFDADVSRNAEIIYSVASHNDNFTVNPITGAVYTAKSFDREELYESTKRTFYEFEVYATDNGMVKLQGNAKVRVNVKDENDNAPVFSQDGYKVKVSENAQMDSVIFTVTATDVDEGVNSAVTYTIVGGNKDGVFGVRADSGQIFLRDYLDREDKEGYVLTIRATDSGEGEKKQFAETLVEILVQDYNDNAPRFAPDTPANITIGEDTEPGEVLEQFTGTDEDATNNGKLRFDIVSGNEGDWFSLDTYTGKLALARELDYETSKGHKLNISLSDSGYPALSVSRMFTIFVTDANDNSPEFTDGFSKILIPEGKTGDIGVVSAKDKDHGDDGTVRFSIYQQMPGGDQFTINPISGELSLRQPLDRESVDTYKITILAVDQDRVESQRRSAEKTLTITVGDTNDNYPVFHSPSVFLVPYPSSTGTTIAAVTASDADLLENGQVTYILSDPSQTLFYLNPTTGTLSLEQSLPRSPLYITVPITAYDQKSRFNRTSRTSLTSITLLLVTSGGQGPTFTSSPRSASVSESAVVGFSLTKVTAVSSSSGLSLAYYVTMVTGSGREHCDLFSIDANSGVIQVAKALDSEQLPSEFLVDITAVESTSTRQRATTTQMTISLEDANDNAPSFSSSLYQASVLETARVGTSVLRVFAIDPDRTGSVTLTLAGTDAAYFRVDNNGVISTSRPLDYESATWFEFRVHASDGPHQASARVHVALLDDNDNAPIFSQPSYSFDLPEDSPPGVTIGRVKATDQDQGPRGHVTYQLASDWGKDFFDLDPRLGEFTLKKAVDFEVRQVYTLQVVARDQGQPSQSSEVRVYLNVKDANDNQPEFDPMSYVIEMPEDAPVGSLVVNVSATDVDTGHNGDVRYSLVRDGDGDGHFGVGPLNGSVYTKGTLDREDTPTYTLVVMATDQAAEVKDRLSTTATVEVLLKDKNDSPPRFITPDNIQVREDSKLDTPVFTILARDPDHGPNGLVIYRLVSQSPGDIFSLRPDTGQLVVQAKLDRETEPVHTLVVEASDRAPVPLSAVQKLTVHVQDANDNAPVFQATPYDAQLDETVPVGTSVLRVVATDDDDGFNSALRYFIVGGRGRQDFHLDMSSGVLRVQKSLDYERTKSYSLTVQAEDSSTERPLDANVTVSISVRDVNDFVPVFDNSPYHTFVQEGIARGFPLPVFNISARDEDSGDNGLVQYALRYSEQTRGVFEIEPLSGEVMVLRTLDRETTPQYVLTIIAIDSGVPSQTGTTTLTVFVKDVNDHSPVFESSGPYLAHVMENQKAGTDVIRVKATDKDEDMNAQILYSLVDNQGGRFTIQPHTGQILTTAPLDREMDSGYQLTVVATDQGIPPRSATAHVKVTVEDDNDHAPEFGQSLYSVVIYDSESASNFVVGVTAIDRDVGKNGQVVYKLLGPDDKAFHIDSQTGVITHTLGLSSDPKTYNFVVRATDMTPQGDRRLNSTANVTVRVAAGSPVNLPVFYPTPVRNIRENARVGTLLATVTASSSRSSRISYHIAGGNVNNAFSINSNNGSIFVAGTIDYEVTKKFNLWLEARDQGQPTSSAFRDLQVTVDDVNDNAPSFTESTYQASVMENCPNRTRVIQVKADDLDAEANSRLVYSLVSGNTNRSFSIDATTGLIITANPNIDREKIPLYKLIVVAVDGGSPKKSATATVRIAIEDADDNEPHFSGTRSVAVPEDIPLHSLILQLTTTDRDEVRQGVATFTLVSADTPFAVDATSGNITNVAHLDAETQERYRPVVSLKDGSYFQQTELTIRLLDVNDNAPKFQSSEIVFKMRELQAAGALVGTLKALDLDISSPNNKFFFSLKRPSSLFELNAETGEIIALETMRFFGGAAMQTMNEHFLEAVVTDLGIPTLSSEATVVVEITDLNDHAPVFSQGKYFSAVTSDLGVGRSILQVEARDEEDYGENAEIRYAVISGPRMLFGINASSGVVFPRQNLEAQKGQTLSLVVMAQDYGKPPKSATATVELEMTGTNRFAPKFTSTDYEATVVENAPKGFLIDTLSGHDDDTGLNGQFTFSITGGNEIDLFKIEPETGELKVEEYLDFEVARQHVITITVTDDALFHKETSLDYVINIRDVNDNAPRFAKSYYDAYVPEHAPLNTPVTHMTASDADFDNVVILYSLVGEGGAESLFSIDRNSGQIRTAKSVFDYEKRAMYTLLVMAYNPAATTGSGEVKNSVTKVFVHVTGVNEYVPRFLQNYYSFQIKESVEIGTSVGQVHATDSDQGADGEVYYYLEGRSNLKGFAIEPLSGIIRVSERPDYESSPHILLKVMAKNWGSVTGNDTDECTVNVTVFDANDPPEFQQAVYRVSIPENSDRLQSVITVKAVDRDVNPENRVFSYEILSGNEQGRFRLSPSGTIETTGLGVLDRETTPSFTLVVGAQDTGTPPELGSATVIIQLTDVNDNGPQFDPLDLTVFVSENEPPGVLVTTLSDHTVDLDEPRNQGPFHYRMPPGPLTSVFRLDDKTGRVETNRTLNREENPRYFVPVVVTDYGIPAMTSTLTFTVVVKDVNNNPPERRPLVLLVNSLDNGRITGVVADVSPIDSDLTGKYTCTITAGDDSNFVINQGCDLQVVGDLSPDTYSLTITATDGKFQPVDYNITVIASDVSKAMMDDSVALILRQTNASSFLQAGKFSQFKQAVQEAFGSSFLCQIYGLKEQAGDLYVVLYVEEADGQLLSKADVARGLTSSRSAIETKCSVSIKSVAASVCAANPCHNDGACSTVVTSISGNQVSNSPLLVLTSSNIELSPACICRPAFTGPLCEESQAKCGSDYCQHEGVCVKEACQCPDNWEGEFCQTDRDECAGPINPCQNGGRCDNIDGSFECRCQDGYHGRLCELHNYCASKPCAQHGTCVELSNSFECRCQYGYHGSRCQTASMSFAPGSYAEFAPVSSYRVFNASFYFATVANDSLLLLSTVQMGSFGLPGYVALEVKNRRVKASFRLSTNEGQAVAMTTTAPVEPGSWYRVEFSKTSQTSHLIVQRCEQTCQRCDKGPDCYREAVYPDANEKIIGRLLSIGGVKRFQDVLELEGSVSTHDFRGCMHSVMVNGHAYSASGPTSGEITPVDSKGVGSECLRSSSESACAGKSCYNDGYCLDKWTHAECVCDAQHFGNECQYKRQPFSLGSNAVITYTVRQSYARDKKLSQLNSRRKRKVADDSTITFRFRTTKGVGMLYTAETTDAKCWLWFEDGSIHFLLKSNLEVTDPLTLAKVRIVDGNWHNLTVTGQGSKFTIDFDGATSLARDFGLQFGFDSVDIVQMAISGKRTLPDNSVIAGFDGCLSRFLINGNSLPMNGSSDRYIIQVTGGVEGECLALCAENPCGGSNKCEVDGESYHCLLMAAEGKGLETGIIVVIVFFAILLLAIVVVFVLFRTRRDVFHQCLKMKKQKQGEEDLANGNSKVGANIIPAGGSTGLGMRYAGNPSEAEIIRNHITEELTGQKANSLSSRPDLIGPSYSPQTLTDGVVILDPDEVQGMMDEDGAPEHYDFENASSIAPSDIAPSDRIRHYRDFRNAAHHPHHHHPHQLPPPHSSHLFNKYRDSPTSLSQHHTNPHMAATLALSQHPRQSPLSLNGSALSVPAHSNAMVAGNVNGDRPSSALAALNQQPRARMSPLTQLHVRSPRTHPHNYSTNNYNNRSRDSRSNSTQSLGSHHSHSSSSTNTTTPAPSGVVGRHSPHKPSGGKDSRSRTPKGLTVEDVNRLNARPDMLIHDVALSSADVRVRGENLPNLLPPPNPVLENALLLEPLDSSSEDSGANDSFTCSEFEYDNEASRTRLDLDPSKMIFSKLTEVDNECDDPVPQVKGQGQAQGGSHRNGLNSNGDSFASTNASSSGSPSTPVQQVRAQYDFDALLNWGPNFDKLVGVFKDIAQLPDSEHVLEGAPDHDYEEYV